MAMLADGPAIDGDVGENARLTYMLVEGDGEGVPSEDAEGEC